MGKNLPLRVNIQSATLEEIEGLKEEITHELDKREPPIKAVRVEANAYGDKEGRIERVELKYWSNWRLVESYRFTRRTGQ